MESLPFVVLASNGAAALADCESRGCRSRGRRGSARSINPGFAQLAAWQPLLPADGRAAHRPYIYAPALSGRMSASAARSSLTGLSVQFWEVREPFREVRPIAPAGR